MPLQSQDDMLFLLRNLIIIIIIIIVIIIIIIIIIITTLLDNTITGRTSSSHCGPLEPNLVRKQGKPRQEIF